MEDVLLICFEQIVSFFSTQMQTNSSCFVKSYNISSLKFFALSLEARLVTLETISNCVAHEGHLMMMIIIYIRKVVGKPHLFPNYSPTESLSLASP